MSKCECVRGVGVANWRMVCYTLRVREVSLSVLVVIFAHVSCDRLCHR